MECGREKCGMLIMRSGKRQITEGIELPNQERIRTFGKKGNLGILEANTIKQAEKKKIVSLTNGKTARNQTLQQKSHQREKHSNCLPCKILGTILEMDEGKTSTNRLEDKKTIDDAQGLTPER